LGYAGQVTAERTAEELLLEFERTGRPEPFEEIVRRYSGMVYHVCHRITRDKHDAEDAVQAVFSALAVGRKEGSGDIRTIGPWLRQVARRVSLDIRRGKKRRQRRETLCACDGSSEDPSPEPSKGGIDAEELRLLLKEELDKLPVKYRMPLVLHYFGGMSQEDMAAELACRPGTLRVRLHRGRHMLARRLAKRGIAVGAVVFAVAMTRAVQSALTDSLSMQFVHGQAATAGGVIQAASVPVVAVNAAMASKFKVACAVLLAAGCVVRAGAEVYQYIRPMQLRLPNPMNIDRVVPRLLDGLELPIKVEGTERPEMPPIMTVVAPGDSILDGPAPVVTPVVPVVRVAGNSVVPATASEAAVATGGTALTPGAGRVLGPIGPRYERPAGPAAVVPFLGGVPGYASPILPMGATSVASGGGGGGGRGSWTAPPARASGRNAVGTGQEAFPPGDAAVKPPPVVTDSKPPTIQVVPNIGGNPGVVPYAVAKAIVLKPTPVAAVSSGAAPAPVHQDSLYMLVQGQSYDLHAAALALNGKGSSGTSTREETIQVSSTTMSGHGAVPATESLDNSGVVMATSPAGKYETLDLSKVAAVTNSVDNPADGRNGWYASERSRLVLPALAVEPGTNSYSWGEDPRDATPDLVNSVRVTVNDAAAGGKVVMSLVAPDRPDAPLIPPDRKVIGLWQLDGDVVAVGGIDLLIRYDALKAYALGATDGHVGLMDFRNQWRSVADSTFVLRPAEHLVGGQVGDVRFFAVSVPADPSAVPPMAMFPVYQVTPEPGCVTLVVVGASLLLCRRRRKMI
jgi:RNA polymerase sigma factor (sigma-70 family)